MKLTEQHLQLIELLADPTDNRTKGEKEKAAGFGKGYVYDLLKDKDFRAALRDRTFELFNTHEVRANARLIQHIESDDPAVSLKALEMYYKITGRIQTGTNVQTHVHQHTHAPLAERIDELRRDRFAEYRERATREDN